MAGILLSFCSIAGAHEPNPRLSSKVIVLTFDDGPRSGILPQILEFLGVEKIVAHFFPQGWQAKKYPELIKKAHDAGHHIENHTYGHGMLTETLKHRGKEGALQDIEDGADAIGNITGVRPIFFRPPHWVIEERYRGAWTPDPKNLLGTCQEKYPDNKVFKEEVECRKFFVQVLDDPRLAKEYRILRDVNTLDYTDAFHKRFQKDPKGAASALAQNVRTLIQRREKAGVNTHILAFHELPVSLSALKILVPEWKKQGYEFLTLFSVYACEGERKCW